MSGIVAIAERIEQTGIGTAIAESRYVFPILEGTHLLSVVLSVGLILLTDLRLLGVFLRHVPVTEVVEQFRPYALVGFVVVFITGGLVFWSEAATVIVSPLWAAKFALIPLAGLNALYFEFVIARRPDYLASGAVPPRSARVAGAASLTLWVLVVICGRLLPYIPHWA